MPQDPVDRKSPWGQGLGWVTFKPGVGPLLRIFEEGERQHLERKASGV